MLPKSAVKVLPKILLALTAVAALLVVYPASVQAVPITYSYTGNPFTSVTPPYTTSMFVTGMLTLAGPLPPNITNKIVSPISFSFSDGVQTLTSGPLVFGSFGFSTDATGMIVSWDLSVQTFDAMSRIRTFSDFEFGVAGDMAHEPGGEVAENVFDPGTWTSTAGVPDSASTLTLLSLSLLALGVAARRFRRAAA